ncbi:peptidoglycan recognition protein family protein [Streptomyces lienomycini]|uniref:Peptidoglycan recognition protein n=1 Tax=Streptomyces lienomycini TaxID=284035 RepID=A0ABV9WZM3_9ACTN|nr:N-acetylmuramoyl-L-alanine amidase [Streptomyces lienomycini]
MRGFPASSIGVTCAAALALPLAPPAAAATSSSTPPSSTPPSSTPPSSTPPSSAPPTAGAGPRSGAYVPGSTRSLPLAHLARDRAPGAAEQGLTRRDVRPFSLVGVVWDRPTAALHGRVEVRTRAAATGIWSGWKELETHNADHAADPGTRESTSGGVRGATAPLWAGESDGVEVRVRSEKATGADRSAPAAARLPTGLRLELVDPGKGVPPGTGRARTGAARSVPAGRKAKPHVGARPGIITRRGWGADETLREKGAVYTKRVKTAFVHHSDTGNDYTCSQAPSVIRGIYRYHVGSMGWRDLGYSFLVDKCGKIYEGRAGGVSKPVLGAHTRGFNSNSTGIAVLGTYSAKEPSSAALKAIARLTAWKVGRYGMNPRGKTYLKSGGGNLYPKGRKVRLNVISGHRDGFATGCPGERLYDRLGSVRSKAGKYQGR